MTFCVNAAKSDLEAYLWSFAIIYFSATPTDVEAIVQIPQIATHGILPDWALPGFFSLKLIPKNYTENKKTANEMLAVS